MYREIKCALSLTTGGAVVLRVGDAWLVGVGKRAPHGFGETMYRKTAAQSRGSCRLNKSVA